MKKNTPSDDEIKNYSHKKMTLPLMEHASEEMKEPVWKLVKKLASYARVPGAMSDFKKMAVFAEDDAIVDVVLDTLQDMKYPFKNTDFIPDIMGYYYSIALISQSMHRREETIKLFHLREIWMFCQRNIPICQIYLKKQRLSIDLMQ